MNVVIEQISPHHLKARTLQAAMTEELGRLYPPTNQHHFDPKNLEENTMLVAWLDGDAVACGILRSLEPGIGEIKRLFVKPAYRRRGLAGMILGALEALALTLGYQIIRLETGTRQPEAIALYQSSAYQKIEAYGEYIGDPMSVCFEKHLNAG